MRNKFSIFQSLSALRALIDAKISGPSSIAASKLIGRQSGSAGSAQEITLGTNLSMSGTTLNASGGAGASWTTHEANLGSSLLSKGRFTITDGTISGSSKIIIQQAPGPYTGKGTRADEAEMDIITAIAYPGSGSAIVYWEVQGYTSFVPDRWNGANWPNNFATSAGDDKRTTYSAKKIGRVRGNVKFNYTVA